MRAVCHRTSTPTQFNFPESVQRCSSLHRKTSQSFLFDCAICGKNHVQNWMRHMPSKPTFLAHRCFVGRLQARFGVEPGVVEDVAGSVIPTADRAGTHCCLRLFAAVRGCCKKQRCVVQNPLVACKENCFVCVLLMLPDRGASQKNRRCMHFASCGNYVHSMQKNATRNVCGSCGTASKNKRAHTMAAAAAAAATAEISCNLASSAAHTEEAVHGGNSHRCCCGRRCCCVRRLYSQINPRLFPQFTLVPSPLHVFLGIGTHMLKYMKEEAEYFGTTTALQSVLKKINVMQRSHFGHALIGAEVKRLLNNNENMADAVTFVSSATAP